MDECHAKRCGTMLGKGHYIMPRVIIMMMPETWWYPDELKQTTGLRGIAELLFGKYNFI